MTSPASPLQPVSLEGVAYQAHFALLQHYSGLVFKVRLSIITLTVLAVSVALGLHPGGTTLTGELSVSIRVVLPYISAWLVALLYGIEVSYIHRFAQVVESGRALEQGAGVSSYFTKYDRPKSWPLQAIYAAAVLALLLVAGRAAWLVDLLRRSPLLYGLAAALPLVVLWLAARRLDRRFGPRDPD